MSRIAGLLREPLVHFLLIGAALFLAFGLFQESGGKAPNRIVVDASQVEQLRAQFARTWLREPTPEEVAGLVANHVRDEVYYREALAMGLDRNDAMVRQRMRQKLEFILEDLTAEEPGDQVLSAYLQQHPDRFRIEPRVSFRQLYLNPDRHPDLAVGATEMLERLDAGATPESVGDPTMLPFEYTQASQSEIARSFGEEFAEAVVQLTPGAWTGPVYSGMGGHLVQVNEHVAGRLPELEEVRSLVEREYLVQRRQELKDLTYQRLLQGYEVVIEPQPGSGDASGSATAVTGPAQGVR